MATDAGELIVKLSADVSDIKSKLSEFSDNMQGIGANTVAVGNVMGSAFQMMGEKAVQFATDSIRAFGEQEQSLLKLSNLVGSDAANAFNAYAQQLSTTTAYSEKDVLALESQLAMYGLTDDQIKLSTGTLIDYAAATGKTLPEAGQVLGQALAGQARGLKALGIEVFATDDRTTRFNSTIRGLSNEFDGMASTMRGTTLGAIDSVGNSFVALESAVGKFLSGPATGVANWLVTFINHVTDSIKIISDFSESIGGVGKMLEAVFLEVIQEVTDMLANFIDRVKVLSPLLKLMHIDIDAIKVSIDNKIQSLQKDIQTTDQSAAVTEQAEGRKIKAISDTQRALDQYLSALNHSIQQEQMVANNIVQISALENQKKILAAQNALDMMIQDEQNLTTVTELETEKRLETAKEAWETNASYSDQLQVAMADDLDKTTANFVTMTTKTLDSFYNSTAKMIYEGGRFKDVIQQLWTQLAEAVIAQILRMIAEWMIWMALSGGGGGLGGMFMAEGGMINEPSLITGLRSGQTHFAGEAGPEMVVPTGGGAGAAANFAFDSAGGDSGGGGGSPSISVNISGQFLEADPSKWQQLVRQSIIPEIQRLTMKWPNGLFNRVRGAS